MASFLHELKPHVSSKCIFVKRQSNKLNIGMGFPSWTESMCLFKSPLALKLALLLSFFDNLSPCVEIFYLNDDKKSIFFNYLPASFCQRFLHKVKTHVFGEWLKGTDHTDPYRPHTDPYRPCVFELVRVTLYGTDPYRPDLTQLDHQVGM